MTVQIAILVLGVGAVFLANDPREPWRRWSSVVGLASQPFWFVATIKAHQWGIVLAAALYTVMWGRGFYYTWMKK